MSQIRTLACSGYFYSQPEKFPLHALNKPCGFGVPPPQSPAQGGVLGEPEGSAKAALFQPAKGEPHPQLPPSAAPCLTEASLCSKMRALKSFLWHYFSGFCFSFVNTKVKINNYFVTWKNTHTDNKMFIIMQLNSLFLLSNYLNIFTSMC